ncbi:sugar ABC transporter substrate-binding protein [Krasilnikoviella flava]|uniref:sugar ABC transporter substrate-binding protein n=1 Tax=Krasilnikoviella flava TaxID=526729 RepID=UPI001591B12C|nr:extracellular solute-binding protein [Krasilnikoviella flava]
MEIWQRKSPGGPSDKIGQELVAAFTKATGIPATMTSISDEFEVKLQQRAVQRNLPDVVINDTAQLGNMQTQGLLRQIDRDAIEGADDVNERAWDGARAYDGDYYGVPVTAHTVALFNRKDWRQNLGLDVPEDWDSLVSMWKAYADGDPTGTGEKVAGLALPGTTQRGYMSWSTSTYFWSGGGEYFEETPDGYRSAVATDESVRAATWIRDLSCKADVLQPGASSYDSGTTKDLFKSGGAGSFLVAPYELASLKEALGSDLEVLTPPPGPAGLVTLAEGNNAYLMAGSANETAQEEFAEFMISAQGQEIGMAGDRDGNIVRLPVNSTVDMADTRDDPDWNLFQKLFDENGRYVPAVPNWNPFLNESAKTLNALISDCSLDVRSEMEKLDDVFTAELAHQEVLAP